MMADLFTITLLQGTVFRWTTFTQPLTISGNTWTPYGAGIQRDTVSLRNTVEVPEIQLTLLSRDTDLMLGKPIKQQILSGILDGAIIRMERIFLPKFQPPAKPDTSLGSFLIFQGRMSSAKVSAAGSTITVKGDNVLMNQYGPKNVYQTSCLHTFCDAGCTLNPASFTISNTVGASPTATLIPWGSVPGTPAIYSLGKITFTSGIASGQVRTVLGADSSGVVLAFPLDDVPALGDTFQVLQGCTKNFNDGSGQSCTDRSNTQNYRGFPFVPPAETGV